MSNGRNVGSNGKKTLSFVHKSFGMDALIQSWNSSSSKNASFAYDSLKKEIESIYSGKYRKLVQVLGLDTTVAASILPVLPYKYKSCYFKALTLRMLGMA